MKLLNSLFFLFLFITVTPNSTYAMNVKPQEQEAKNPLLSEIQNIIATGGDINAVDEDGYALIHRAVGSGNVTALQILLDPKNGVDVNARIAAGNYRGFPEFNYQGYTALHYVIGMPSLCGWLSYDVRKEIIRVLLSPGTGLDINATVTTGDRQSYTALHLAVSHPQFLDMLVAAKGIDFEASIAESFPFEGMKAIHLATMPSSFPYGQQANIQALVRAGANPHSMVTTGCWQGYTALHFAVKHGLIQLVEFFLATDNVDVNVMVTHGDYRGATPLHLAARYGAGNVFDSTIIKMLLTSGADKTTLVSGESVYEAAIKWGFFDKRTLALLKIEEDK